MIDRDIKKKLQTLSKEYPVILIQGPRQSGKTTLCKMLFTDKPYVLLETPDVRERALDDPIGFLNSYPDGAIFDEIQRVPSLLSYIQGVVDSKSVPGMFVLTGSNNLLLMEAVSQTLAGRVAIFNLLPFSMQEARQLYSTEDASERILKGGYPRLLTQNMTITPFFENYISTYVEKDVRSVLRIKDSALFSKFVSLCAARIGNPLELSDLANSCGISTKTANEWLSILETSFVCFKLNPYYENKTKRLIKSPKLYFYDTGLACSLLGIKNINQLKNDSMHGALFENLVVLEYVKKKYNSLSGENLYYYRTSDGIEVDLVIESNRELQPIEIKSTQTFHSEWLKGINVFKGEYDNTKNPMVIYAGAESINYKETLIVNHLSPEVLHFN